VWPKRAPRNRLTGSKESLTSEKRYQVFVSSTYRDLEEERRAVIQTVIALDCIPAGMELFPAADEEQFAFIKRVIDDCDYYLLIIGGRYGSVDAAGISYTEKEFDYAVSRGLKVVGLIHENPGKIALDKSEKEPAQREKLEKFKTKVRDGRLVKGWNNTSELPGLVAVSLQNAIKTYPAVGWIRASKAASEDLLNEINELRKQNARMQRVLSELKPPPAIAGLAGLDEEITLRGEYSDGRIRYRAYEVKTTWRQIFLHVSPYLEKSPNEYDVKRTLEKAYSVGTDSSYHLDDQIFQTIGVQLKALGLVKITYSPPTEGFARTLLSPTAGIWSLTRSGEHLMLELRTIRSKTK